MLPVPPVNSEGECQCFSWERLLEESSMFPKVARSGTHVVFIRRGQVFNHYHYFHLYVVLLLAFFSSVSPIPCGKFS